MTGAESYLAKVIILVYGAQEGRWDGSVLSVTSFMRLCGLLNETVVARGGFDLSTG